MAVRNMLRWPLRSGFTLLGIALACGLMVTALLSFDSVDLMVDVAFNRMDRQHATIEFGEPNHPRATRAVAGLPGVMRTEPYRSGAGAPRQRRPLAATVDRRPRRQP